MAGYQSLFRQKSKRKSSWRKFLVGSTILTFVLTGFITARTFLFKGEAAVETRPQGLSETTQQHQGGTSSDVKSLGLLLLGYGGAGHEGGNLTDVLQVVYIDFAKAKIALISIPRDLWVTLPSGKGIKINGAFSSFGKEGSASLKQFISKISGLKIDYYGGIDFVGFERTVGINLKGIEVDVSETLDDPWYPIRGNELETCGMTPQEVAELSAKYSGFELESQFPCRYKHLLFERGKVAMQGGEALAYARSRHGSSAGDISRGKRQQEVLLALKKKILSVESLDNLPDFFTGLSKNIATDLDSEVVKFLIPAIQNAKDFQVVRINLSTENVLKADSSSAAGAILIQKEGVNNWSAVQKFLEEEINK